MSRRKHHLSVQRERPINCTQNTSIANERKSYGDHFGYCSGTRDSSAEQTLTLRKEELQVSSVEEHEENVSVNDTDARVNSSLFVTDRQQDPLAPAHSFHV